MLNAEIIGNEVRSTVANENPTLYSTVIHPHKTAIKHPNDFLSLRGFTTDAGSVSAFNAQQSELARLGQGEMAIPVKLEMSSSLVNDPTLSKYETPSFLNTKKEKINGSQIIKVPKTPMLSPNIVAGSAKDLKMIQSKLSSAKNRKEKLNACKIK